MGDAGVDVEGPVRRGDVGQAQRRQGRQQKGAVAPIDLDMAVEFGGRVHGGEARVLA
eukprot:gene7300-9848_t